MKIGILTMNYTQNYGGILQCLALQNTLSGMGHSVEVIRFTNKEKNGLPRKARIFASLYMSPRKIYNFAADSLDERKTLKVPFQKEFIAPSIDFITGNIKYTDTVSETTIGSLAQKYDAIIAGSDKIWGGLGKTHLTYLFDWTPPFRGKRISYAACSSLPKVPSFNRRKFRELIFRFDGLSVRDGNTCELVRKETGITPQIVADPTLLYNFDHLAGERICREEYILTYILGSSIKGSGGHAAAINKIKNKYGDIKVIAVVLAGHSYDIASVADEVVYNASPSDWVNYIKHAAFIYTDSFHGCLFSMKYEKPFLAYYSLAHRSTRLLDIACRYGISENIVSSVSEIDTKGSLDKGSNYRAITPLIEKHVKESLAFLENALTSGNPRQE